MKILRFEDLEVWKEGRKLSRKIYVLTRGKNSLGIILLWIR